MKESRLVAFDYDGVIVDSLDHNLSLARRAAQRIGQTRFPNRDDVERLDNMSFGDIAHLIRLPEEKIGEFTGYIFKELATDMDSLRVFPGMAELIRQLAESHTLAVITSNAEAPVERFLQTAGLRECFESVLGAESPGPKAEKLRRSAETLKVARSQVYMVGDCVSDIRQAKLAGVASVAVTWGYHSEGKLVRESPDYVVHTPAEIARVLDAATRPCLSWCALTKLRIVERHGEGREGTYRPTRTTRFLGPAEEEQE